MELLLNVVWFVVALGLSVLLAFHQRKRQQKLSVFTIAVTVVCLAVLLFAPISLSDDLHPVKFAIEDSVRNSASLVSHAQHQVAPLIAPFAPVSVLHPLGPGRFRERIETKHQVLEGFSSFPEPRGPPSAHFRHA
jgi:hypothetical protein